MTSDEIIKQARYIFSVNRYIRIHTSRKDNEKDENRQEQELSATQFLAVEAVDQHESLSIKELSEILGISSPSTTALVDKLVEKCLFTREQSQEDRRKVIVRISPGANIIIDQAKEVYTRKVVDLIHKVGPETTEKWIEVLAELKKAVEK